MRNRRKKTEAIANQPRFLLDLLSARLPWVIINRGACEDKVRSFRLLPEEICQVKVVHQEKRFVSLSARGDGETPIYLKFTEWCTFGRCLPL